MEDEARLLLTYHLRRSFDFFFLGTFCVVDVFLGLDAELAEFGLLRRCLTKSSFATGFLFPLVVGIDLDCRSTMLLRWTALPPYHRKREERGLPRF